MDLISPYTGKWSYYSSMANGLASSMPGIICHGNKDLNKAMCHCKGFSSSGNRLITLSGAGVLQSYPQVAMITDKITQWCIYASMNWVINSSINGWPSNCNWPIAWTSTDIFLTGIGIIFCEIWIEIHFSFKKIYLKMVFARSQPFCSDLNVLIVICTKTHVLQYEQIYIDWMQIAGHCPPEVSLSMTSVVNNLIHHECKVILNHYSLKTSRITILGQVM